MSPRIFDRTTGDLTDDRRSGAGAQCPFPAPL